MSNKDEVMVGLRLERELRDSFAAACAANDETVSQVIRRAMRAYVAANSQAALPFEKAKRRGKA